MPRFLKIALVSLAALLVLLVAAAGILAATFNPNDYKPLIVKLVQEKKQRTLSIPGEIRLTFFPRIGADLGRVSISERNGSAEFASVNSAKVSLALLPLLSKQLVVDRVKIDGLNASIRRNKDGSTNYDDLLSKDQSSEGQVKFDIDGVSITNSHVLYDDRQAGRRFELSGIEIDTGKIASGAPGKLSLAAAVKGDNPAVDARVALKTGFTFDLDKKRYAIKGADAEIKGSLLDFSDLTLKAAGDADLMPQDKRFQLDGIKLSAAGKRAGAPLELRFEAPSLAITDARVAGGKLSGEAKLTEGGRNIVASFSAPSFEGSPQAFKLPSLALDVAVKDAQLDAKARLTGSIAGDIDKLLFSSPQLKLALSGRQGETALDGTLTTPFAANLGAQTIELGNIAAGFTLPNPGGGALKLNAAGRAGIDLGKKTVAAQLKGNLDESAFDAKFGLTRFSPAAYTFDIGIDKIDADRYIGKGKGGAPQPQEANKGAGKPADKPIDLSGLKDLQARGTLRVGAFKANNIRLSNLRADLHAGGGKLEVSPLAAALYGGTVNGALSATATKTPRIAVRQTLAGVNIGPLLKDATGSERLEGHGNVTLDVATEGGLVAQMKKNLAGNARLALKDGAVHGINVAQVVRGAKARIGELRGDAPAQSGTASDNDKTDFSEMSASFVIANGIAHNDDLSVKSPLIRAAGAGDINIGEDRLDYTVRVTVVSTLQGQGGPELQSLKGLTVPVRLSGPFSAIGYSVDFKGMASDLAKQKLDEKKEEVRSRAKEALGKQTDKLQEQLLKDGLKGLFGK